MKPDKTYQIMKVIVIFIILSGIGLLSYPILANWYNDHCTSRIVSEYNKHVTELDESAVAELFAAADSFNSELLNRAGRWEFDDQDREQYNQILDISGTGMIGTLFIPKLGVSVPFYHGNSDTVLQIAAGHMEGSSFPIDGSTTHAVIAAHTGMASMELFTKLDQMESGDQFMVQILNKQYVYQVSEIHTVLPTEMKYLEFQANRNLTTLLTCTPLGVNSHRLLVTGELIDIVDVTDDMLKSNSNTTSVMDFIFYIVLILVGCVILVVVIRKSRQSKRVTSS